jgi:hypothetical protein
MKNFFSRHRNSMRLQHMDLLNLKGTDEQYRREIFNQFSTMGDSLEKKSDEEKTLVLNLCELFSEMDFNGDRLIEWEDFTSYLIEAATEQNMNLDRIKEVYIY